MMSRRSGSTCWPATSPGWSVTTPAARTSRSSATPVTTASRRRQRAAAPSAACAPGSARAAAELTSWAPARRYALPTKGTIGVGYDADFCLVDPSATWTVHAEDSESTQEYTPFEGFELNARVSDTWVRGRQVL